MQTFTLICTVIFTLSIVLNVIFFRMYKKEKKERKALEVRIQNMNDFNAKRKEEEQKANEEKHNLDSNNVSTAVSIMHKLSQNRRSNK